jgi:hypothetical protein
MKITKTQLRQIIKEEVENTLDEVQAGSQAQQASAQRASLVKTINANVRTIEKMAEEIMMKEFERAMSMGFPFGRMIQGLLDDKLKEQGFDDTRLDAVFDYLKTFAKNKELRKYLSNPGLEID